MLNIITIDYPLEGKGIVNTTLEGNETLLDADLIIIDPNQIFEKWRLQVTIPDHGTPVLRSPQSDQYRRQLASREQEIETLLRNGKVIVCFLEPIRGFNGQIRDSRDYHLVTNYDILPIEESFFLESLSSGTSAVKNAVNLANPNHLFTPFFHAFKSEIEYTAYLNIQSGHKNHFILNRSNLPIAFSSEYNQGLIVFLPHIPYNRKNEKLINTLVKCVNSFLNATEITPPPNWIEEFNLPGENTIDKTINSIQEDIDKLQLKKEEAQNQKSEIVKFKKMLYEQGSELELVIIDAFRLFGFNAENRKLADLEHDIIFHSEEGKGIAEIEGKNNDSIHVGKMDQLNRAVDEDFELTEEFAHGILIGNHFRFKKPDDRGEPFTNKVKIIAEKKRFGLLTTTEIYKAVSYILEHPSNDEFKRKCREAILTSEGQEIRLI